MAKTTLLIILFSFLLFISCTQTSMSNKPSIKLNLIHQQSEKSPFRIANLSVEDRANHLFNSSHNRLALIHERISKSSYDIVPSVLLLPEVWYYFVQLSIGEPPITQYAVMDTGSTLLWLDNNLCSSCCRGVDCYFEVKPYDLTKSTTYTPVSCGDNRCDKSLGYSCNIYHQCVFVQPYISGLNISGTLATEKLTFGTSNSIFPDVLFGMAADKTFGQVGENKIGGIFGLCLKGDASFIGTFGFNFSYCLGGVTNVNYDRNVLVIGDKAVLNGTAIPFESYNGQYFLTLEGISIGEDRLNINPDVFVKKDYNGGVIIDSGVTLTFLTRPAYEEVRARTHQIMLRLFFAEQYRTGWSDDLCFKMRNIENIQYFPDFIFHFGNNADLRVNGIRMFYEKIAGRVVCLGIAPNGANNREDDQRHLSMIGLNAQEYVNVGHDPMGKMIHLQEVFGCADLYGNSS